MSRIAIPTRDQAAAETHAALDTVGKNLGFVPNLHRLMSLSPNTLTAFFGIQSNLGRTLDLKTREAIGIVISEGSGCDYCIAAHSHIAATKGGVSADEIALNRQGTSSDAKRAAAVGFARKVAETRGRVSDNDLALLRQAGWADSQVIEIAALTAQFLLTNFINNIGQPEVDFPVLEEAALA